MNSLIVTYGKAAVNSNQRTAFYIEINGTYFSRAFREYFNDKIP